VNIYKEQLEFQSREWIDRKHSIRIQVPKNSMNIAARIKALLNIYNLRTVTRIKRQRIEEFITTKTIGFNIRVRNQIEGWV